MLCKKTINWHGESLCTKDNSKSKFACILEASESTRMRKERILPKIHEDQISGKGSDSLHHYNLVHTFIPMPQTRRYPQQRQQWTKNVKNLRKFQRRIWTKVKNTSEVIDEARKEEKNGAFCLTDGHLSFDECRIGDETPEVQGSSCAPKATLWKTIGALMQYLQSKDRLRHKWLPQK